MDRLLDHRILTWKVAALPTFDARTYLALNPDIALPESEALPHFAAHGLRENRSYAAAWTVAAAFGRLDPPQPVAEIGTPEELGQMLGRLAGEVVGLYVHAASDPRVRFEAEMLAARLAEWGVAVTIRDETADPEARPEHPLVFAPHEFFALEGGARWREPGILATTVLCPTRPLHATPPVHTLPYLFACRAVLDDNVQTGQVCAALGIPFAERLIPPGDGVRLAAGHEDDLLAPGLPDGLAPPEAAAPNWDARRIDLCLFGTRSTICDEVLLSAAPVFAALDGFLPYPEPPLSALRRRALGPARIALEHHVARNAKLVLAVDPEEIGSLQAYRAALLGFRNGALVVSRPLYPHPVFRPGEHFLAETTREIPHLVAWLLRTPEGAAEARRIAARARETLAAVYGTRGPLAALRLIDATRPPRAAFRAG